ncbi:hypothetical protein LDL59_10460 [Kaistella anthropi]|nr:hypothetical protein [Kaistella anthropi]
MSIIILHGSRVSNKKSNPLDLIFNMINFKKRLRL